MHRIKLRIRFTRTDPSPQSLRLHDYLNPQPTVVGVDGSTPYARHLCHLKTVGLHQGAPSVQQRSSPLINLWLSDAISQLDGVRTPQEPARSSSQWSIIIGAAGFHTYLSSPEWGSTRLHSKTKFFIFQTETEGVSCPLHHPRRLITMFPWEAPDCSMQIGAGHSVKGPRLQVG